jgi:hypothetical protein
LAVTTTAAGHDADVNDRCTLEAAFDVTSRRMTATGRVLPVAVRQSPAYCVEKLPFPRGKTSRQKIGLSDRSICLS